MIDLAFFRPVHLPYRTWKPQSNSATRIPLPPTPSNSLVSCVVGASPASDANKSHESSAFCSPSGARRSRLNRAEEGPTHRPASPRYRSGRAHTWQPSSWDKSSIGRWAHRKGPTNGWRRRWWWWWRRHRGCRESDGSFCRSGSRLPGSSQQQQPTSSEAGVRSTGIEISRHAPG